MDVICPVCSGRGHRVLPVTEGKVPCGLCAGEGFITAELEESFWACAGRPFRTPTMCIEEVQRGSVAP